jgi:hypothetical protein
MELQLLTRYKFTVRTRTGFVMEQSIPGHDAEEARRKLLQIYRECEILEGDEHSAGAFASAEHREVRLRVVG